MSERDAELAWAAGLFEGEGTITRMTAKSSQTRFNAAVIMTDEDVLRRFSEVVGLGKLYGPYQPTNPKAKPIWRWTLRRYTELVELYELIGPWMGQRRSARFVSALEANAQNPFRQRRYLTQDERGAVRRSYAAGGVTHQELSRQFGVSRQQIQRLLRSVSDAPLAVNAPKLNAPPKK